MLRIISPVSTKYASTNHEAEHQKESSEEELLLSESPFSEAVLKIVFRSAAPHILYPIVRSDSKPTPKKIVFNVAALQAFAIRLCQTQIVESVAKTFRKETDYSLPEKIHRYCESCPPRNKARSCLRLVGEALRDMDYMQERAKDGFDSDPFLLMTSRQAERRIMNTYGLLPPELSYRLPEPVDIEHPIMPGVGRTARIHAAQRKVKLYNVLSALLGGLALIVPMVIMKLVPSRICVLVTTCGFVVGFALGVALWSALKHNEILAVTAAYAAVLVVFVGTTRQ